MLKFISVFFLFSTTVFAAPFPGTSSSSFLKTELGMFRSAEGFSIHAAKTAWIHSPAPPDNKYIVTIYKAPYLSKGVQPALTVRFNKLKKNLIVH